MLSSLIRPLRTSSSAETPEDLFSTSLGLIFTDDAQNQHGDDASTKLLYTSLALGRDLEFQVADPEKQEDRSRFAHYLWNAGVLMGDLIGGRPKVEDSERWEKEMGRKCDTRSRWWLDNDEEERRWNVEGQTVLELGAGVGLAGIVSALKGAEEVVVSDYPAPEILKALKANVQRNAASCAHIKIEGHQWGVFDTGFAQEYAGKFTRVIAADCLWMPHEHANLAKSISHFLSAEVGARAFVIGAFHTGRAKMAPFFEVVVREQDLDIEEIFEMDVDGRRVDWAAERDGVRENVGERKKWLVLARLKKRKVVDMPP